MELLQLEHYKISLKSQKNPAKNGIDHFFLQTVELIEYKETEEEELEDTILSESNEKSNGEENIKGGTYIIR